MGIVSREKQSVSAWTCVASVSSERPDKLYNNYVKHPVNVACAVY